VCFGFGCHRQQKRHAAARPPTGVRRRMKRKRQKLVGRDKGSLTEQQTKGTGTTTIQIRRKRDKNSHNRPSLPDRTSAAHSRAESEFPPQRNPAWRHMVWNTRLCLARLGLGLPTRLCPFLDFWWKLTLSWPNPGHYPPLIPYHLHRAQVPHCPVDHHHFSCLQISFP